MKSKTQKSCALTAQLISAFGFALRIVQSLYYLNPKFQTPSYLLWLYNPVCVAPGRNPQRPVFSQRGSIITDVEEGCSHSTGSCCSPVSFETEVSHRDGIIKLISCSTQLSMNTVQRICKHINNCVHFNINEQNNYKLLVLMV